MNPKMEIVIDLLAELYDLPKDAIQPEFFDFLKIVSNGAKKYSMNNWLDPQGSSNSHKEMHSSIFRHIADSYGMNTRDRESGEDPLLHAQCRCAMSYTLRKRGIVHSKDTV